MKPKIEWRRDDAYVWNLYAGCVRSQRPHSDLWRAYVSTDEDGTHVGLFDFRSEACEAVERAIRKAMAMDGIAHANE